MVIYLGTQRMNIFPDLENDIVTVAQFFKVIMSKLHMTPQNEAWDAKSEQIIIFSL